MKRSLLVCLVLLTSFAWASNSESVDLIPLKQIKNGGATVRWVAAMPVRLSPAVLEMQRMRCQQLQTTKVNPVVRSFPNEVNLTMNGVPVLDQGNYATCVTFAVIAALDAAINKGDYISPICLLQLSSNVTSDTYWHSLWKGSSVRTVLSYISEYGIMTTEDQKKGYCNKVKTYPFDFDDKMTKYKMSRKDYHQYSEECLQKYEIESQVLFMFGHHNSAPSETSGILTLGNINDGWVTPEDAFVTMRKSLAEGNRIILEYIFKGELLREGTNKVANDTWFASNELKSILNRDQSVGNPKGWYLHSVVIYGYDDNAIVRTNKGEVQKGVFYVRNSWGEMALEEYMTYDFFKLLSMEATSLNTPKQS